MKEASRFTRVVQLFLRKRGGTLWRGALCWALGCLFLLSDEGSSFDTRFQVRGDHAPAQEIVLITIRPSELGRNRRLFPDLSEAVEVTDSYYWDPRMWSELLRTLLAQDPKKIGVTFFFNENLGTLKGPSEQQMPFQDPRVVWAGLVSAADRPTWPLTSTYDHRNVGSIELLRDEDGVIRRFMPLHGDVPHFIERMSEKTISRAKQINYKGSARIFPEYSLTDVMEGRLPPESLKGKYVLIGPESPTSTQYLTPLGFTHRAAVLGQLLDNAITESWIRKAPTGVYMLFFVLLEILCILLIIQYPQSVAFVFLVWIGTFIVALSVWVFDSFSTWLPVFSPLLMILTTWIIFLGSRANEIEHRNFQLKQEQKALEALEQLKNNFVSLISHDLKTPIAKIRGVTDRLIASTPVGAPPEQREDLEKLRDFSDELNRYIQSILKVLRVEARDFRLNLDVDDINSTIEEVIEQARPLAQAKNIQISTELEPLFSIEADFTLIREVLLNLVENAIKYGAENGRVRLKSREIDGFVRVDVSDDGPGIAPGDLGAVWGKFVRGRDQDLKTKGSGLGLYLVKYFVELHGGRVEIESELKKGTTVSFLLPLEPEGRSQLMES
jgi:signal transduction histidine kinase